MHYANVLVSGSTDFAPFGQLLFASYTDKSLSPVILDVMQAASGLLVDDHDRLALARVTAAEAIIALTATASPSAIRADFSLAVPSVSIPLLLASILLVRAPPAVSRPA
jgi:hypothetical protein